MINPKPEILNSKQIQNPNFLNLKRIVLGFESLILSLFRVYGLGFRVLEEKQ